MFFVCFFNRLFAFVGSSRLVLHFHARCVQTLAVHIHAVGVSRCCLVAAHVHRQQ